MFHSSFRQLVYAFSILETVSNHEIRDVRMFATLVRSGSKGIIFFSDNFHGCFHKALNDADIVR